MIPPRLLLILCLCATHSWAGQTRLDVPALVVMLLAQGYHDIREVTLAGDKFEVETLDAKQQKVLLMIDAYSGKITRLAPPKSG